MMDFVFCPSKYTDFNCAEMGKRDTSGELTDAVRAEGIRMDFIIRLIDWQYANDPIF